MESYGSSVTAELTCSALPSLRAPEEDVNRSSELPGDGEDEPKLSKTLDLTDNEEDLVATNAQSNRPSLYIGPPETSYSCDSISEFTPNLDDQELYISSFSESDDEQDADGDDYDDASDSEPSRYYSALGQHDSELERAGGHTHLRRSLSYTFSNDPDRYHPNVSDNCWPCGRKISAAELDESRTMSLMTRSFDELLIDTNGKWCADHRNCYCRYCWVSQMPRFVLQTKDGSELNSNTRHSRMLSPPYAGVRRFRSNTTGGTSQTVASNPSTLQVPGDKNVIRHDANDHGRLRLVRYPVRAMTRFASDPSLPLGHAWTEATNASDKAAGFRTTPGTANPQEDHLAAESSHHQLVFVTLTTPPPDDDDSEPLLHQFLNYAGTTQAHPFGNDRAVVVDIAPSLGATHARSLCSGKDGNDEQCQTANSFSACTHNVAIKPSVHDGCGSSSICSFPHISSNAPLTVPFPQSPSHPVPAQIVPTNVTMLPRSSVENGSSGGAVYSSMMATAIATTTTTVTTTTTAVPGPADAATAADPNDDGANNGTSTSSTITGSCLYCCTGGPTTASRMAGPGALSHGSGSLSSCCCCCCCCCSTPSSSAGGLAGTGVGGPAGTSNATTVRRQRHSIAGQMSYFKMLGTFSKKMATSTNSLFSTAVISGSSSAPNLRDMIPSTASPSGFGGVPPIRPLETLHNALSLKQLDAFLERMTTGPLFKTPASSPPPKHPLVTAATVSTLPNVGSKSPLSVVHREPFPDGPTALAQPAAVAPPAGSVEDKYTTRAGIRDFAPFATVGQQQGATAASGGTAAIPSAGTASSINGANVTGAQQSWSDHSSSMTSSISALSSGGPSSPNYSEVYSRGCPSSDMSASITSSTDGLAAIAGGGGGGTSEQLVALPQLFSHPQPGAAGARMSPKHPYIESFGKFGEEDTKQQDDQQQQLACGGETLTALVRPDGTLEGSTPADAYLRRSSTMDISGDLTPVSGCSDWESNTNEATKGSTTNYDLTTANTTEEDDEDATISTDTCLSVGDQDQQQAWSLKTSLELSSSATAGGVLSEFRCDAPVHRRDDTPDSGGKVDSRVRGSRIQRQISLYENESRTSETKLHPKAHEWSGEGYKVDTGGSIGSYSVQLTRQQQASNMSFDELRQELPSRERNMPRYHQEHSKNVTSLTVAQQQDGTTSAASHTPGALVIREGYIEPPRLTRVTKSFHGKTDHQKLTVELQRDAVRSATDAVGGGLRRASDIPAAETGRYSKSTLRLQHSSAGTGSSQGRFTTSLVQEAEQLSAMDQFNQQHRIAPFYVRNLLFYFIIGNVGHGGNEIAVNYLSNTRTYQP
uniref:Uncharacterized protein n=1 Tax=Anopheles culicifacies TaxID=139723 RepID=A0A182M761_9DIPT